MGRSHALKLASLGAAVVVNDPARSPNGGGFVADDVVAEIKAAGGVAVADYHAVGSSESAKGIAQTALSNFGRIDVLINNAGILRDKTFAKLSEEEWDQVLRVHLTGSAHCAHAVWETMKAQAYGRILFTTSCSGLYGNFGQANYGAAKMGLVGLMNVLKQEAGKYGILVNALAPVAATNMNEGVMDPAIKKYFQPEHATAGAVAMCSKVFDKSGVILSAMAGHYALIEVTSTPGLQCPPDAVAAPEEILENWARIADSRGRLLFGNAGLEVEHVVSGLAR